MARPPASEQVQVNFRMPSDLKARIEAAAVANNRTTTAELVATLEEKYPAPTISADDALGVFLLFLDHLEDELASLHVDTSSIESVRRQVSDLPQSDRPAFAIHTLNQMQDRFGGVLPFKLPPPTDD